jgi:glycosyltransferase involved in cell wall biosynthesis
MYSVGTRENATESASGRGWARTVLPNLLYVADVPVENSYHGSALVCRLLRNYPSSRLRVVEVGFVSQNNRRLVGVEYRHLRLPLKRLLMTRFDRLASSALVSSGGVTQAALSIAAKGFCPDAVLTVVHGYSWNSAVRFARKFNLPYHLIIHDDWDKTFNAADILMPMLHRRFGDTYRNAASRLCVSPYMADHYRRQYGVSGDVLYPSRAAGVVGFDTPSQRVNEVGSTFTIAFAGSINSPGCVAALRSVAQALEPINGRLAIFGPISDLGAQRAGLVGANVQLKGLVSSDELIKTCREEVDALVVPMSFDPKDRANMTLSFPSKLTDYTAIGLPIIIFGPPYCSAVNWAVEHPNVAEVVDINDVAFLESTIVRLSRDPQRRKQLACRALQVGRTCFDQAIAEQKLFDTIARAAKQKLRVEGVY